MDPFCFPPECTNTSVHAFNFMNAGTNQILMYHTCTSGEWSSSGDTVF